MRLAQLSPDCTIISVGTIHNWNFEEHIFQNFPRCKIHSFDCNARPDLRPPDEIAIRTTLHRQCVGSVGSNSSAGDSPAWKSVLDRIGATQAPLFLRLDTGASELEVLRSIMDDGRMLPSQISFETHLAGQGQTLDPRARGDGAPDSEAVAKRLCRKGGYAVLDQRRGDRPHRYRLLVGREFCDCAAAHRGRGQVSQI